jgi:hypothetical protein
MADGRKLQPGDVIDCSPEDVSFAKDKFMQLDPDPGPPKPVVGLKIVKHENGECNIVNESTGVRLNDVSLTEDEAKEMAPDAKIKNYESSLMAEMEDDAPGDETAVEGGGSDEEA